MKMGSSSLRDLARLSDARSMRASSWDRTGGNDDRLHIAPGATVTLMEYDGAGCITHIWTTIACRASPASFSPPPAESPTLSPYRR